MQNPTQSKPTLRERLKAAGLHLAFSLVLLGIALYLVFALWYPAPLHIATGVTRVFLILLTADVLLGPLLTLIVYKKDWPQLRIDLAIILLLQVSAFTYGLATVSQGRPVWLAFVVNDFELVRPIDIDRRQSANFLPQHQESLWKGPRWVAAVYSDLPAVRKDQLEDEMFNGISLAQRPETYASLATRSAQMQSRGRHPDDLKKYNDPGLVKAVLSQWPTSAKWLPLKGPAQDMVVLLDVDGNVLAIVDLRPWQ